MKNLGRLLLSLLFGLILPSLHAGSAAWNLDPGSGDCNTATNWTPATIPRLASDVATFGQTDNPNLSLTTPIDLGEMILLLEQAATPSDSVTVARSTFTARESRTILA